MGLTRREFLSTSAMAAVVSGSVGLGQAVDGPTASGKPNQAAAAWNETPRPSPSAEKEGEERTVVFQRQLPIRHKVDVFVAGGKPPGWLPLWPSNTKPIPEASRFRNFRIA